MKHSKFAVVVLALVMVFLYLPIVVLVGNSFNASKFGGEWTGFTFKWYATLFASQNSAIWEAFQRSLVIAATATVASCVLGTADSLVVRSRTIRIGELDLDSTPVITAPLDANPGIVLSAETKNSSRERLIWLEKHSCRSHKRIPPA